MQEPKPQFFDTHKYVTSLTQAGMSEAQAEVFVNTQVQILVQVNSIEARIQALDRKVDDKIRSLREELKGEIRDTKDELRGEIQNTKDELRGEIQNTKDELRGEMQAIGKNLSNKILLAATVIGVLVAVFGYLNLHK